MDFKSFLPSLFKTHFHVHSLSSVTLLSLSLSHLFFLKLSLASNKKFSFRLPSLLLLLIFCGKKGRKSRVEGEKVFPVWIMYYTIPYLSVMVFESRIEGTSETRERSTGRRNGVKEWSEREEDRERMKREEREAFNHLKIYRHFLAFTFHSFLALWLFLSLSDMFTWRIWEEEKSSSTRAREEGEEKKGKKTNSEWARWW